MTRPLARALAAVRSRLAAKQSRALAARLAELSAGVDGPVVVWAWEEASAQVPGLAVAG